MINPYSSYILSFGLCLIAYWLEWSELYPPLTGSLFVFLLSTILLHAGMSFFWNLKINVPFKEPESPFDPVAVTVFIYVLWIADFVYEGGIPFIKILFNIPYDYRLFGIPSVHVFTVTFSSFFTVFLFSQFISSGKRVYFYLYLINLSAALLIYSRAMMIFNITSSAFIYLISSPTFSRRRLAYMAVGFVLLIYLFGVMGSVRTSFEKKVSYDASPFLDVGKASADFRESFIPKEFFWGYVYLTSPLANLQYNVNMDPYPPLSLAVIAQHINNEMLFDFISKRVNQVFGIKRETEHTLPRTPFNVSTVYARSFSYQGWTGMWMMAAFVLIFPCIYARIVPPNGYALCGIAILNTMFLFLFYDNTIRFTGLGFQLVYPFAMPIAEKASVWFKKLAKQV